MYVYKQIEHTTSLNVFCQRHKQADIARDPKHPETIGSVSSSLCDTQKFGDTYNRASLSQPPVTQKKTTRKRKNGHYALFFPMNEELSEAISLD